MRALVLSALMLCAAPAAARENYAILIGANTYPALDERYWLKGPANDVRLVQTYLTTAAPVPFAAANVMVLADGVTTAPTLAAIRAAFADLTAQVTPGDFVYLHFSGHGTQAPALDPDSELDGLDELFLPTDIGPWSDAVGAVENGLVDDEIGRMIDALRARGADVWAVFDSCHSGTVTRAAPSGNEEVRTRQLPPDALGLPEPEFGFEAARGLEDPRAAPEAPLDVGEGAGGFVAFYAAQTNEVTPEKNLPKGKPGRVPQGVFTYALFETLAEYPAATYRQIGQEVLRKYATRSLARSTPMFEGDLDRVAFSGTPGDRVAQWAASRDGETFSLAAGTLHGLATGEVLAVLASAADATSAALGFVEITEARTFAATAVPVVHEGLTLPDDLPRGLILRRLGGAIDYTLTIALPEPGSAPAAALATAMAALTVEAGPRLMFVLAGIPADLTLAVLPDSPRPDAVWVLPGTGLADTDYASIPSVTTADKDAATLGATLADTLNTMARAINLLKLGASVGAGTLDVAVEMQTRTPGNRTLRALSTSTVPRLVPEDEVHILARNNMDIAVDVNVLFIGADYSITHWAAERMQPGNTLKKGLFKIGDKVLGSERMVVVLTPAAAQSPVENLAFLAQDALDLTREVSFGTRGLTGALTEAGFGATTRSAMALTDQVETGPAPGILQLELRTVPAAK